MKKLKEIYNIKGVNGILKVYENCIKIERKGIMSFLTHGLSGDKTIPFSSIKTVQMTKGTMFTNGYIQFGILGSLDSNKGLFEATKDENSFVFYKKQNEQMEEIKQYIEKYVI